MKVLFVARHFTYFRNFESVIRLLAERGHAVHLAAERDEALGGATLVERLAAAYPRVTYGEAPHREPDDWAPIVTRLRLAFDYLRYLEPTYEGTPRLRARAAARASAFAVRFGASRWSRVRPARALLRWLLRAAERAVPSSAQIAAYLASVAPDVMLITPLIGVVGSPQPDYMRAARQLGIPSALCVWSWDHLSSKALIRDVPDEVIVWNETQRGEATRFHGVAPGRVRVTGAQCFDQWFGRGPSRRRDAFCAAVGLRPEQPFVLYVGSALFGGSPPEAAFVLRWLAHLRRSTDPRLRDIGVIIRPHPQRAGEWAGVDREALAGAVVWGGNPVTDDARADYFDSLYFSAAVVGLNTSAFLEAAIVGRPVLAPLPDEYRDNQEGTIHFHYLTGVAGGLLQTARTLDEHARQLADAITGAPRPDRHAAFLRAFIRPRGLDQAATPEFVAAVEGLPSGRRRPSAVRVPFAGVALLAAWRRLAASRHRHWLMDEEDRRAAAWRREKAEFRAAQRRAGLDARARAEAEDEMRTHRTMP